MTILREKKKVDEFLDLKNFDKIRTTGSLSGWQRNIYNLITKTTFFRKDDGLC